MDRGSDIGRDETDAAHSGGTVGKALDVLDLVIEFGRPVRFAELQEASSLPKATLYRLVRTLTDQRMLAQDPADGAYRAGLRLVRLAHAAWRQSALAPIARPFLDALSERVGETIHLAQLDEGQVLYVDKRNAHQPIEMFSAAGKVGPAYCTGVGKAMLAFLPDGERERALRQQGYLRHTENTLTTPEALQAVLDTIREDGISFDREEHEPGIVCIAAPILSQGGRVLGGLSITTATHRRTLDDLARLTPDLQSTAKAISEAAANWQFPE